MKVLQGSEQRRESSTPSSNAGVYKSDLETATGDKGEVHSVSLRAVASLPKVPTSGL